MTTSTAILIASFGTTHDGARHNCINTLEERVSQRFSAFRTATAFTSGIVRKLLDRRNIVVPSPEEAMRRFADEGARNLAVLPTHVLAGYEYEKLLRAVRENAGLFDKTVVASPLLNTQEDTETVMSAVMRAYSVRPGEGLVLVGHGTRHEANAVYQEINIHLKGRDRSNVFVGTLEAEPGLAEAVAFMKGQGIRRVTLAPLMFVAGDHAENDMAGGKGSWLDAFLEAGFEAKAALKGLGEIRAVRELYLEHLARVLPVG